MKVERNVLQITEERRLRRYGHLKRISDRIPKILECRIDGKRKWGRPKELYEREDRFILRMVKNNPRISAPKLTSEMWNTRGRMFRRQKIQIQEGCKHT